MDSAGVSELKLEVAERAGGRVRGVGAARLLLCGAQGCCCGELGRGGEHCLSGQAQLACAVCDGGCARGARRSALP